MMRLRSGSAVAFLLAALAPVAGAAGCKDDAPAATTTPSATTTTTSPTSPPTGTATARTGLFSARINVPGPP